MHNPGVDSSSAVQIRDQAKNKGRWQGEVEDGISIADKKLNGG